MKRYLGVSALLFCLLFLLPLAMAAPQVLAQRQTEPPEEDEPKIELLPPGEIDGSYTLRVLLDGGVQTMTMVEYLQGVVRAEMPASFEQQALCAQAVAARTYTLYKMASGGNHGGEADVCGDHTCCQAYLDRETAGTLGRSRGELRGQGGKRRVPDGRADDLIRRRAGAGGIPFVLRRVDEERR